MKRKIIFFTSISLFLLLASAGSFFVIKHSKNNVSEQVTDGEQKYFYIEVNGGDFEITNGKETAYKGKADVEPYRPYIEGDLDMSFAGDGYKIPDFGSEEQEYKISFLKEREYDVTIQYNVIEEDNFYFSLENFSFGWISFSKDKKFELFLEKPTLVSLSIGASGCEVPWILAKLKSDCSGISGEITEQSIRLYSNDKSCVDICFLGKHDELEIKDIPIDKEGITISSDRRGNCIIKRKWKVLYKEYFGWPEEE